MRTVALLLGISFCLLSGLGCSRSARYYADRGNELLRAGKSDEAALQYKKALQKDPKFADALYQLGLIAAEQKQFGDAYTMLTRAVQAAPSKEDARIKLADVSLALYLYDPAKPKVLYDQIDNTATQLISNNPSSFDGLRLKGMLNLLDQKPKEAIGYFEKGNMVQPLQRDLVVGWVQALYLDHQPKEAERLALQLIQREPSFGPIYDVLSDQYRSSNRVGDAEHLLITKSKNNPAQADYILQLAAFYAQSQKPAEMTATLQRLLADPKDFPQGHLKVGDFYAQVGNFSEAVREFQAGADSNSNDKLVYQKRLVDALLNEGKRKDAGQVVDAILKDHPKDNDARRVHASIRMASGNPDDLNAAINEFTALLKESPNDPTLRFNFGRAWLAKGDLERARAEFQEAVRIRGNYSAALTALIELNLQLQKPTDAFRYAQQLVSFEPQNQRARVLGVASLIASGRYEEAHSELAILSREFPGNGDLQLQAGFLAIAEKKYADAERLFRLARQASPSDSRSEAGLVEVYTAQRQFEQAIRVLTDDLKTSSEPGMIRGLLADTAFRAGKLDVAMASYQELLSTEPKSAELLIRLGMVYQAKGDHTGAVTALKQATQFAPGAPLAHALLAISLEKTHQTEQAIASYQRALQLQPDNPTVLNNLAYLLADKGNSDEALRLVQQALRKFPAQPTYSDTLGYIYLKKKMNESAVRTFDHLVEQYPNSPVFRYHLGMALLEIGDKANARIQLESALANQPSAEDALKVKELLSSL